MLKPNSNLTVVFIYLVGAVAHSGPRQIEDVQGDARGLEQSGAGHVLLNLGQNRNDAQCHAHDLKSKKSY